jgi:hypothetical protein
MNEVEFEPSSFDVVWSEGAIYLMGFESGLARIKEFVKPRGYVAVSDAVSCSQKPETKSLSSKDTCGSTVTPSSSCDDEEDIWGHTIILSSNTEKSRFLMAALWKMPIVNSWTRTGDTEFSVPR